MNNPQKIYVAGHRGMVGSAIVRQLIDQGHNPERGPEQILARTHSELDLTNQAAVNAFFAEQKPNQVYLAAARVGGIYANNTYPAEFIYQVCYSDPGFSASGKTGSKAATGSISNGMCATRCPCTWSSARQSGDWDGAAMAPTDFQRLLRERIDTLDIEQARADVRPFLRDARVLEIWSARYFRDLGGKVAYA